MIQGQVPAPPRDEQAPKTYFLSPQAVMNSLGLGYRNSPSPFGYETLDLMARKHIITAGIIQLRMHQVASFTQPQRNRYSIGYRISHRDPKRVLSEGERNFAREMEDFMERGGAVEVEGNDLNTTTKRMVRDRLTYDQICMELVSTYGGKPYGFYPQPSSTIRFAMPTDKRNTPPRGPQLSENVRYVQVIDNQIKNVWASDEMVFSVANPRTDIYGWNYGMSESEILADTVTRHLYAEQWNTNAFSQGSTTKGILNIKGSMTRENFETFRAQWLAQISGVNNAWRTPMINSKEDLQWISLQPTNQEMGYQQWIEYLTKTACMVFLVDPAELNFDTRAGAGQAPMFMSNNEAQQKLSQDRGLRPLLKQLSGIFTKHIIARFDPDWIFEYVGLDAKTEEQAIELRLKELQAYKTINEVRRSEQLPPVPDGDIIPSGAYIGYRNQKEMMAAQGGGAGGPPGGDTQPPPPGSEDAKEADKLRVKVGDKPEGNALAVPDRMRNDDDLEEWERTYKSFDLELAKVMEPLALAKSEDEPRDKSGRWTAGGASSADAEEAEEAEEAIKSATEDRAGAIAEAKEQLKTEHHDAKQQHKDAMSTLMADHKDAIKEFNKDLKEALADAATERKDLLEDAESDEERADVEERHKAITADATAQHARDVKDQEDSTGQQKRDADRELAQALRSAQRDHDDAVSDAEDTHHEVLVSYGKAQPKDAKAEARKKLAIKKQRLKEDHEAQLTAAIEDHEAMYGKDDETAKSLRRRRA